MLILLSVFGIALLLRTQHLSDISMHFDECCSWKISQFPWPEMLDAVSRDAHPPLYYMVLKGLGSLLGDSVAVLRGFSVLMGMATIAAAMWFVRTAVPVNETRRSVVSERGFAMLLAAMLVTLSGLQVEMSLEVRPYVLGTLLALVAATFLLRGLQSGAKVIDWTFFTFAAGALSLTHYYGLFTVAALYVFAAAVVVSEWWHDGWSRTTKRHAAGIALSAWAVQLMWLAWLPTFLFQRARSTSQLWMDDLDWPTFSKACFQTIAGGRSTIVPQDWAWAGVAAWGAIAVAACLCGRRGATLSGLCAGLPVAAVVAYGLIVRNILGVKYLIFAQLFLLIGAAILTARIPWNWLRVGVAAALVVWTGYWSWDHAEAREYLAECAGVGGAVEYLDALRGPNEPVIVGSPFVLPIVQKYTRDPSGICVRYHGDHRGNILSGPALRESEYRKVDEMLKQPWKRIWTVDAYGMFGRGSRFEVNLPTVTWILERQEEFRERNGIACILAVRSYRRRVKSEQSPRTEALVQTGPAKRWGERSE